VRPGRVIGRLRPPVARHTPSSAGRAGASGYEPDASSYRTDLAAAATWDDIITVVTVSGKMHTRASCGRRVRATMMWEWPA